MSHRDVLLDLLSRLKLSAQWYNFPDSQECVEAIRWALDEITRLSKPLGAVSVDTLAAVEKQYAGYFALLLLLQQYGVSAATAAARAQTLAMWNP